MKKFNANFLILGILGSIILCCGVGIMGLHLHSKTISTRSGLTVHMNDEAKSDVTIALGIHSDKHWTQSPGVMGAEFDGVITNHSYSELNHWRVQIKVPDGSYIDSSWNGIYDMHGNTITIYPPVDYNRSIAPKETITFGFIMYTQAGYTPKDVTLTYFTSINLREYGLYWILIVIFGVASVAFVTYLSALSRLRYLERAQKKSKAFISQTLQLFAHAIETKGDYSKNHAKNVSLYSKELAARYGLSEHEQEIIYYSAILHDIGKISVSDAILNKNSPLTDEEYEIIREHAERGANLLYGFEYVPGIADIVRHHHENYDGSGYPFGLIGEEIPMASRIICVANALDAMSSPRAYRDVLTEDKIVAEFRRCSERQFDPKLVDLVIQMIEDGILQKRQAY